MIYNYVYLTVSPYHAPFFKPENEFSIVVKDLVWHLKADSWKHTISKLNQILYVQSIVSRYKTFNKKQSL